MTSPQFQLRTGIDSLTRLGVNQRPLEGILGSCTVLGCHSYVLAPISTSNRRIRDVIPRVYDHLKSSISQLEQESMNADVLLDYLTKEALSVRPRLAQSRSSIVPLVASFMNRGGGYYAQLFVLGNRISEAASRKSYHFNEASAIDADYELLKGVLR